MRSATFVSIAALVGGVFATPIERRGGSGSSWGWSEEIVNGQVVQSHGWTSEWGAPAAATDAPAPAPAAPAAPVQTTAAPVDTKQNTVAQNTNNGDSSSGGSSAGTDDYQKTVLAHHNAHRANHSAPALDWSSDLEASAQIIANTCVFGHKMDVNGGGYGQNIASGVSKDRIGDVISNLFYNGEMQDFGNNLYNKPDPTQVGGDLEKWGHFTQLVWSGTKHVGCATVHCPGDSGPGDYTVCNYGPPGNVLGYFNDNVKPATGGPYIDGASPLDKLASAFHLSL